MLRTGYNNRNFIILAKFSNSRFLCKTLTIIFGSKLDVERQHFVRKSYHSSTISNERMVKISKHPN